MNIFHRTTALLLLTITSLVTTAGGNEANAAPAPAPTAAATPAKLVVEPTPQAAPLTVINATTDQTSAVNEAIAQFNDAGLDLPPLQIEFYEDEAGCHGHEGMHHPATQAGTPDRIVICNRMKIILLHELAHAWKHHNLTEQTQVLFSEHWGLDNWNDKDQAWNDRGIERAAHTIAFTLNQEDPNVSDAVLRYICGYELLTGTTLDIHTKIDC